MGYRLEVIAIDIHQLMGLQQTLYLRPYLCQQSVKLAQAKVAKAQVNHPGWRTAHQDAVGEIGIFADDDQVMGSGVFPYLSVGRVDAKFPGVFDRQGGGKADPAGQVFVEQKAFQATRSIRN